MVALALIDSGTLTEARSTGHPMVNPSGTIHNRYRYGTDNNSAGQRLETSPVMLTASTDLLVSSITDCSSRQYHPLVIGCR